MEDSDSGVLRYGALHHAIIQEDVEGIRDIIREKSFLVYKLEEKWERSPLFLSVKHNLPPDIIQNLLQIYPEAASVPNSMGEIPLHVVRNTNTARLLISCFPGGLYKRTKAKWLPIHTARTADVAKLLLEEGKRLDDQVYHHGKNGSAEVMLFSRDEEGLTPLEKLATSLEFCLSCTRQRTPLNHITAILWDKLCLLTKAMVDYCMYFQEDIDLSTRNKNHTAGFQMVHSWIALRDMMAGGHDWFFFELILEVALDLYPRQLHEKDALGRTPLIIAINYRSSSSEEYFDERHFDGHETSSSHGLVYSLLQRSKAEAATSDGRGRMPLHLAIRNDLGIQSIKLIAMSAPKILMIRDPITNLYPFMLASIESGADGVNGDGNKNHRSRRGMLNKIYYLLREAPAAVTI